MSLVIFQSQVNMLTVATPSIGGFIVAYDLDGKLKQKDSNGVITLVGATGYAGSLVATLASGNNSGTYSILMGNNTAIASVVGTASIKLDNNFIRLSTDGDSYRESYVTISPTQVNLTAKGGTSSILLSDSVEIAYKNTDKIHLTNDLFYVTLNGDKVVNFTTSTASQPAGPKISGVISSEQSYFSTLVTNSLILGGNNIVGTQSNSVYVPNILSQGPIKGINGTAYLDFTQYNEAFLTSGDYMIGLVSSSNSLPNKNGIIMVDTLNSFSTTSIVNTGITYISSVNSSNNSGIVNSVVIGGFGLSATESNTVYLGNNVNINNAYKLPITDGSANQVIITDGMGNLSWTSSVSGGTTSTLTYSVAQNLTEVLTAGYEAEDLPIKLFSGDFFAEHTFDYSQYFNQENIAGQIWSEVNYQGLFLHDNVNSKDASYNVDRITNNDVDYPLPDGVTSKIATIKDVEDVVGSLNNLQNVASNGNVFEDSLHRITINPSNVFIEGNNREAEYTYDGAMLSYDNGFRTYYHYNGLSFLNASLEVLSNYHYTGLNFSLDNYNSNFTASGLSFQDGGVVLGLNNNSLTFSNDVNNRVITLQSEGEIFTIKGDNYLDGFLDMNFIDKNIQIGDLGNAQNGTLILVDDLNSSIDLQADNGLSLNGDAVLTEVANSYFTTETLTGGKWINNKPIYRKVIEYTFDSSGMGVSIPHGISNLEDIVEGKIITTLLGKIDTMSANLSWGDCYVTSTNVEIENTGAIIDLDIKVILEYTKTTD